MDTVAADKPAPVADKEVSSVNIAELASDWFTTRTSRIGTLARLAAAEARFAAVNLALMAFLAVLAAIFVFSAYGLGVASLVNGLLAAGFSLWMIFFGLAVVHVIIAVLLWISMLRLGRNVEFRETRQRLFVSTEDDS